MKYGELPKIVKYIRPIKGGKQQLPKFRDNLDNGWAISFRMLQRNYHNETVQAAKSLPKEQPKKLNTKTIKETVDLRHEQLSKKKQAILFL